MKRIFLIITLLAAFYSCGRTQENRHEEYPNQVGEITFDEKIDDPAFKASDSFANFTKPRYNGEKPAIVNYFKEKYNSQGFEKINGYVTIRFFVNKEGKSGKFRMETMDFDYRETEFDKKFTNKILQLTKELKDWKPLQYEEVYYSYYSYLNFKIINGEIKEITP